MSQHVADITTRIAKDEVALYLTSTTPIIDAGPLLTVEIPPPTSMVRLVWEFSPNAGSNGFGPSNVIGCVGVSVDGDDPTVTTVYSTCLINETYVRPTLAGVNISTPFAAYPGPLEPGEHTFALWYWLNHDSSDYPVVITDRLLEVQLEY